MWKIVQECNLYEVSETGLVRRVDNKHELKGCITSGYRSVKFTFIDGHQQRFYVHRLVAEHFIREPRDGEVVNHKDGNKLNNNVNNLEWVTQRDNILHYYHEIQTEKHTRKNNGKKTPVIQYDLEWNELARFDSVSEASRATEIKIGAISYVINGRLEHTGPYRWKRQ